MERKDNIVVESKEKKSYEVEGYATCSSAAHRCLYDCLGGVFWTAKN